MVGSVRLLTRLRGLVMRRSTAEHHLEDLFGTHVRVRMVEAAAVARALEGQPAAAAARAGERVYREFLRTCLVDHRLSAEELSDLEHLRSILQLDEARVSLIHRGVAREVYSRSVEEVVADGRVDEEERHFLTELRDRLEIPHPIAENILDVKARQQRARSEPADMVSRPQDGRR